MNIVVLDGYALNPGDLSWGNLENLGNCTVYERTAADEIIERAKDADIIVVNKTVIDRKVIEELPTLKFIAETATGYNNIDLTAAKEKGVVVSNVPAYSTDSVVQMIFAHILNFTNKVAEHANSVNSGKWENAKDFCFWNSSLTELKGKTLGIIGFGNIGKAVSHIAHAFGMKVLVSTRTKRDIKDINFVEKNELFKDSDFIALACALTADTHHIINKDSLSLMKKSAFLINTGRGPLIDEQALAYAIKDGEIAGAGLDVLEEEPPKNGSPLIGLDNCFITPHIAWASTEARERLMGVTVDNVRAFIDGSPINVIV